MAMQGQLAVTALHTGAAALETIGAFAGHPFQAHALGAGEGLKQIGGGEVPEPRPDRVEALSDPFDGLCLSLPQVVRVIQGPKLAHQFPHLGLTRLPWVCSVSACTKSVRAA
jgi:hypothetical protein